MAAAEPVVPVVVWIDRFDKLRHSLRANAHVRVATSCQAFPCAAAVSFVKIEEGEAEAAKSHWLTSLTVLEGECEGGPNIVFAAAVSRSIQIDLPKLSIQAVSSKVEWPVGGGVADLEVEAASSDSIYADIAVDEQRRQCGVLETTEVVCHYCRIKEIESSVNWQIQPAWWCRW